MTGAPFLLLCIQVPMTAQDVRVVVTPAETMFVALSGVGEPVVLVPGLLGGSYGFRKVVPLLNDDGFRTHVVELLGTGQSSRPRAADYSLEAQAGRVAAVMDSLNVTRAIIVAHAIGGSIAARLAARRPDLVDGLVLIEGGTAESATTPGFRRAMRFTPLIRILGVGKVRGRIREQLIAASGDASWVEPGVVEAYTADAARDLGATLSVLRAMSASRDRDSIGIRLPGIHASVLLLLGGAPHAGGPPATEIELMTRSLPDFVADTLSGVGHFPHEESPGSVRSAVLRVRQSRVSMMRLRPTG